MEKNCSFIIVLVTVLLMCGCRTRTSVLKESEEHKTVRCIEEDSDIILSLDSSCIMQWTDSVVDWFYEKILIDSAGQVVAKELEHGREKYHNGSGSIIAQSDWDFRIRTNAVSTDSVNNERENEVKRHASGKPPWGACFGAILFFVVILIYCKNGSKS